jgi:hypothetical protein
VYREQWRRVPGTRGEYFASSLGRIRNRAGLILKQRSDARGYRRCSAGMTARLVLRAFYGPPRGRWARYRNEDRGDCRPANLYYCSPAQTAIDGYASGDRIGPRGERQGGAKLTEDEVREILALDGTMTRAEIASKYWVSRQTVNDIVWGLTWRHVPRIVARESRAQGR